MIGVLLSWILATFVKTDPDTHLPFTIGETFVFSTWLTMVLAIVMGTLSITSEVQHGTLGSAVTTQPARWVIVVAKAVVSSGLGLAFCKLVIDAHGGRIWVRSTEGEGSAFHILLPLSPPAQPAS